MVICFSLQTLDLRRWSAKKTLREAERVREVQTSLTAPRDISFIGRRGEVEVSCMIMCQSGICGISYVIIARPRIYLQKQKSRVGTFHSFGHVTAACLSSSFKNGYKANAKSSSRVRTYSKGQWRWKEFVSAPFMFARDYGSLRPLFLPAIVNHEKEKFTIIPRATDSDDVPAKFRRKGYPPMQTKPKWWWRVLATIPYLLTLHVCWMRAKTAFKLHPFVEEWKYYCKIFIYNFLARLPRRILTFYFIFGYLGIVRSNRWPHFFRFHLINGMLLEILFQICAQFSRWLPRGIYWGKFGQHYWLFLFFAYWCTCIMCIHCALKGYYADVPFVSDAAYMQIPVD